MAKSRTIECDKCGAQFETTAHNTRWCLECRAKIRGDNSNRGYSARALSDDTARIRRERQKRLAARDERLRARDAEYAKLGVPVERRVAANGMVVEIRGQPHFGSCCGTRGGTNAEVARRFLWTSH